MNRNSNKYKFKPINVRKSIRLFDRIYETKNKEYLDYTNENILKMDINKDTRESILIIKNYKLIIYILKDISTSTNNHEDLFQIGIIGLIKAINSFKEEKKVKFTTYAYRCIYNEILMELRKKHPRTVSIDESITYYDDGNEMHISNILGHNYTSEKFNKIILHEELAKYINELPEREKYIIINRYFKERKFKDIAQDLGITRSWASRIHNNTLKRLNKKFNRIYKII